MSENIDEIILRLMGAVGATNQKALADKLDVHPAGITEAKRKKKIPSDWIVKISLETGYMPEWLLTGSGPQTKKNKGEGNTSPAPEITHRIPVISWVQAGDWTEIVDVYQPGEETEWVAVSRKVGQRAFGLRISGTSMEPLFLEGDIIVVDPDVEAESGKLVVARLNHDNEATFKKLVRDGGRTYLEPLNKRYQPIDITDRDVTICGVVRQVIREV